MNAPAFVWMIALPLLAAPAIYVAGHLGHLDGRERRFAYRAALTALLLTWIPFVIAARDFLADGPAAFTLGAVTLRMDGLGLLLGGLALALGTAVTLYSGPYLGGEENREKYFAMLSASVGVMTGLGCAGDLFNLWVWFEAMAVSSYLLVAFYRNQPASLEAGVKYLVQSAAGSALVLLGVALVLGQTGTLDLEAIRTAAPSGSVTLLAAGALLLIGFGVKAALVPLHTWLPDAHSQAPSGISAMLSGVVIEAGLVALLRGAAALTAVTLSWGVLLMAFGALNMIFGNLMALRQTQVKRMLAFSSLAHVGYMLLGLGVGLYAGDAAGAQGGMFHLLTHGLMKGLAFLSAGALLWALHVAVGDHGPLTVADLSGAARRYPLIGLALAIAALALGGLPPLAGFMSEMQIFAAGFATQNLWITLLVIFGALNSVISLAYYAPLVSAIYKREPSEAVQRGQPVPLALRLPLIVMGVGVIVVGLWPALLTWLSEPAGAALLAAMGG